MAALIISFEKISICSKSFKEHKQTISSTQIGIGVNHVNEVIYNFMNKNSNHQNINYIEMNLGLINSTYSLMCHKSKNTTNGKETLNNQVLKEQENKKNIIGAINGDFFNLESGIPVCNNLINGEFFSTSLTKDEEILRPCFAILEDNSIDIDHYHFSGNINLIDNNSYKTQVNIDSINRNDYIENTINIFNHKNNENSTIYLPKEKEDALIILITPENLDSSFYNLKTIKGKIKNIINDPANTYKIFKDEIAIVAYNDKKSLFSKAFNNMDVEINFEIKKSSDYSTPQIKHLLTGHEFILYDNEIPDKNYFSETWNSSSVYSKNHRTALALTDRNTLIILTVDKKDSFKGMSLPELGNFLKSKGAYKAINLDGGGSTSMMIRELGIHALKKINLAREDRSISNSIMITNLLPYTTDIKEFYFHDSPQINRDENKKLNFVAYDTNLNPIDIYLLPDLKLTSDVGIFDINGVFYPVQIPCEGTITIEIGKIIKTYTIEIK